MFTKHNVRSNDLFGSVSFGGGSGSGSGSNTNATREWHGNSMGGTGGSGSLSDVVRAANVTAGAACAAAPVTYKPAACGVAAVTAALDGIVNHSWGD